MSMPEPEGKELLEWVRSEGLQPTIDWLSASHDVQKVHTAGAEMCLTKHDRCLLSHGTVARTSHPRSQAWRELSRVLTPQHRFSLHQSVLQHVAQFWDAKTQVERLNA